MTTKIECQKVCEILHEMGVENGKRVTDETVYQAIETVVGNSDIIKLRTKVLMVSLRFLSPTREYIFDTGQ